MQRNPDLQENEAGTRVATSNTTGNGVAPQPSSVIGAPEPPPQVIEATGGSGAVTVLNPFGPVNRLSEGGITFAYPDLIYSQFIDTDNQIEVTDDTSPGTLILQIPYDPQSEWCNSYIKSYARMHNRYNGDLIYRAQIIGNPTFSGTVLWFWWPTKYPQKIVNMADAMKYAYKTQSIQLNSVEELILKDARQYLYYRDTREQDIESRPHLCLMVHTSVVSPLRVGIKIRIRIGTRLASASPIDRAKGCIPFIFADPTPIASTPTPGADAINGRSLSDIFPHIAVRPFHLTLDGTTSFPYSLLDDAGNYREFSFYMPSPTLVGGVFKTNPQRRLVATDFQQGIISADRIRTCLIIGQFSPSIEQTIAQDQEFIDICKGDDWLSKVSALSALKKSLTVNVIRENAVSLQIYKDPDSAFEVVLVKQMALLTNHGKVYVFAYNNVVPSNSLIYAAQGGIPNIAGGSEPILPNNQVLGPITLTAGLTNFPSTWVGLKFNLEKPTVVQTNDEVAPSLFSDGSILTFFTRLSAGAVADQLLQFDLVDSESQTRVCTIRYLPTRQEFVINPLDNIKYRQYPGDARNLIIANYGVVPSASSFPNSDLTNWPNRFPASSMVADVKFNTLFKQLGINTSDSRANAALAGEALETLTGSLDSAAGVLRGALPRAIPHTHVSELLMSENPIKFLEDTQNPTVIDYNNFIRTVRPPMNTVENAPQTLEDQDTSSDCPTCDNSDSGKTLNDHMDDFHKKFKGLKPMSLSEIAAMSRAYVSSHFANGNVMGDMVGSGLNWAHDRDLTSINQAYGAHQNDLNRGFQQQQQTRQFGHEDIMQQAKFSQDQTMQRSGFQHDFDMQKGSFAHDTEMQSNTFGQQTKMQQANFSQQQSMSNLDFSHNMDLSKMNISGNLLNTALGGGIGAATNLATAGIGLYKQHSDQQFQADQNTRSFNNRIQASGVSSPALKISSY